jgi:uncharacterized protein (DUF1800 family)
MADRKLVAHLLRRATFGPTPAEIDALAGHDYAEAVRSVLSPSTMDTAVPLPSYAYAPDGGRTDDETTDLATAWLGRMVSTPHQLPEKLVFFWHGHWATSVEKVDSVALMRRQLETFRSLGTGNFNLFAKAMVRDPALIRWLDGQRNSRRAPNENLGRELMELFTLGIGAYTEADVKAAARALTGWTVNRADGTSAFMPDRFAKGKKTILGVTLDFDADKLIDHLVRQPAHARFLASRLWHRFGSSDPVPDATRDAMVMAYGFRHDVNEMLIAMLRDPRFQASAGHLVKQPVEWAVGAVRQLGVPWSQTIAKPLLNGVRAMGQMPLRPPSVGGWPSGSAWLTTSTLQVRMKVAASLAQAVPDSVLAQLRDVDALGHVLAVDAWTERTKAALTAAKSKPQRMVALALVSPEYAVH